MEEQEATSEEIGAEIEPISINHFFESVSPSKWCLVENSVEFKAKPNIKDYYLKTPRLLLHCSSNICSGTRTFRSQTEHRFFNEERKNFFVEYICANCTRTRKSFSIQVERGKSDSLPSRIYKYGEEPPFGPSTPPRLLRLFGTDQHLFLKGRRCESQGLGVGAFAYYRRVVELHKNQILSEIIKVAKRVGADEAQIAALENAKAEFQFSNAIDSVKVAIPQTLLIRGENPLTLLHSALSVGLHDESDEHCLELAHAVRIVLIELAERISAALKDEAELTSAISQLMQAKNPQRKSQTKRKTKT